MNYIESDEIKKLDLPRRVQNIFLENDINFKELCEMDMLDILKIRGIGIISFKKILKIRENNNKL